MAFLEVDRVTKHYRLEEQGGRVVEALAEVSASVDEGRFVTFVGPSGCGKSTLLEIIAGLRGPTSGEVRLRGKAIRGPDRSLGVVFQEESTFPWRTVLGNVEFGLEVAGVPRAERRERCGRILKLVGLAGFEHARPRELSGGMRQRVAIARALAYDPDILLMDEPFGALDQQTRTFLGRELLRIWAETKKTILFVTHDIHEAVYLAQQVWVMSARPGRLREIVTVDAPFPRDFTDQRFQPLMAHIWHHIESEWHEQWADASS